MTTNTAETAAFYRVLERTIADRQEFIQTANEWVAEGWIPAGGITYHFYSNTETMRQSFYRPIEVI